MDGTALVVYQIGGGVVLRREQSVTRAGFRGVEKQTHRLAGIGRGRRLVFLHHATATATTTTGTRSTTVVGAGCGRRIGPLCTGGPAVGGICQRRVGYGGRCGVRSGVARSGFLPNRLRIAGGWGGRLGFIDSIAGITDAEVGAGEDFVLDGGEQRLVADFTARCGERRRYRQGIERVNIYPGSRAGGVWWSVSGVATAAADTQGADSFRILGKVLEGGGHVIHDPVTDIFPAGIRVVENHGVTLGASGRAGPLERR